MPRFGTFSESNAGIGVTVAANDSAQRWKNIADYVCDGTADQTEINAAIVEAATYGVTGNTGSFVYLYPGTYTLSATITMNRIRTSLLGFGSGEGQEVAIVGTALGATTAAITVTQTHLAIRGLAITSGGYGIELNAAINTKILNCYIWACGNYGIYMHGGVWINTIESCWIGNNSNAQIYCVTPNSGEQNGNALKLISNTITGAAARGVVWNGVGLHCFGNDIEGAGNIGLEIGQNTTNAPNAAYIAGNYFEGWAVACIRIGDSGASTTVHNPNTIGAYGVGIFGNYINKTQAGHGIQVSQMTGGKIDSSNVFAATGGAGAGRSINTTSASEGVEISVPLTDYNTSTYDTAKVFGSTNRWISLNGDTQQIGIPWTAGAARSNSLINSAPTGYFYISTEPNDLFRRFLISVNSVGALNTATVTFESLQAANPNAAWATVSGYSSEIITGSGIVNYPSAGAVSARAADGYLYRLRIVIDATISAGTNYWLDNPRVEMVLT